MTIVIKASSPGQILIRANRDKAPFVLIATVFAFLVSGFFVATTVFDSNGARDSYSDINTFRSATESEVAETTFQHDATINFKDDAIIGGGFFVISAVITVICLVAYNKSYNYLTLSDDGETLHLRRRAKSKIRAIPLSSITDIEVGEREFDDALAEAHDSSHVAPCELVIVAEGKRFCVHAPSRVLAEAAKIAIDAACA